MCITQIVIIGFMTALNLFSFFRAVGLYQACFTSTPYVVCCEKLVCHTAAIVDNGDVLL